MFGKFLLKLYYKTAKIVTIPPQIVNSFLLILNLNYARNSFPLFGQLHQLFSFILKFSFSDNSPNVPTKSVL